VSGLTEQLLDRAPVGIIAYRLDDLADDRSLRLIYANATAGKLLGLDFAPMIGRRLVDITPNVPEERLRSYARACREQVTLDMGTINYSDPKVAPATITLQLTAVSLADQSCAVYFENLTVQRMDARHTAQLNRFLDSIVESIPAMVFVKHAADLRFARFNQAGEQLLGLSRDALLGKNDHDLFPREQADAFTAKDREVLAGRVAVDIPEEPIDTPRGLRWLHTRKTPILGEDGQPLYLLGVSIDITERKQAEQVLRMSHDNLAAELQRTEDQLRHAQKMEAIGRLAGGIAHDFNNLLSVVLSYSDLAMRGLADDDPRRADIAEIKLAGKRAADLTGQLLAFSRQQVLQPRVLDLNGVVAGMERMIRRLIGEDIELHARTAPDLGKVSADPGQIEQVLMNLVVNARDAMTGHGKLTIETANTELDDAYAAAHVGARSGPHVMLAVTDTGGGMDRDTLARVFEPFFTTKEAGKGTGLGLSTVYGIIKQSGGSIWVYSEPGAGATFKIYLPRVDGESKPAPPPAAAIDLRGDETILVVEDEDQVRAVVARILTRLGYDVLVAARPSEALRLAAVEDGIDMVLTDVVMPEMSGRELAERLRARRPDLRVLFMSGYTDDAVVRHGVLEAHVSFLQKPFTPDALARHVRLVLDHGTSRF
jgi:two-component system, cell cycle sensor histidine kinase and response regulator CckA